jgi:SAM-dependent methyltransferase
MNDIEQVRAYYRAILPYYDEALADRGDLPFWKSIAERWGSRRILELGCGTGRVTEVLSRHASVIAVDLLVEMLDHARRRAPRANFVAADQRKFAFASPFDLAVLADDPLAHLTSSDERMQVMQLIADHLTAGGRVVLEGLYRPLRKESLIPARDIRRDGQKLFAVEESWKPADDDSMWKATYRYIDGSSVTEATSVLRSWTLDEVDCLQSAGLHIENLWGGFDGRPFCATSARILIVAKRGERKAV